MQEEQRDEAIPEAQEPTLAPRPAPATKPAQTKARPVQRKDVRVASHGAPQKAQPTPRPKAAAPRSGSASAEPESPALPSEPAQPAASIPAAAVAKHLASSAKHLAASEKVGTAKEKLRIAVGSIPMRDVLARAWAAMRTLYARLRTLPKPAWIAIGVVVGVYVVGCMWFSSHFLPGTTVNGTDASGMSRGAFEALVDDIGDSYKLNVSGDGLSLALDADDFGLSFDSERFARDAFAHNHAWTWPVGLFLRHAISASDGVSYDESTLKAYVSGAVEQVNAFATPPRNASLSYDDAKGSFVVTEPQEGTVINTKAVQAKVERAISSLEQDVKLGKSELVQASVQLDDTRMNAAIVQANNRANLTIDLRLADQVVATVDTDQVRSWMTLDDDCEVTGDLEAIETYTRGELSAALDTVGTLRTYTRADDGKQIQVYGGTYGWSIDGSTLATMIANSIARGSADPIDIPTLSEGYTWVQGGQDWGPGYIDVDLGEQIVRMFDSTGSLVLLTYCVTGDTETNNGTITGVYSIQEMSSPKTLIGLDSDGDGEPDYENDVTYWMSFFGGYGLHDALWRDLFGGTVFQSSGSHGCVNLPYSQAQLMYNSVSLGYPVVVHL